MKYTITTFDNEGNEIVSRDYQSTRSREDYADQIESILDSSQTYLEEQAVDYKEEHKHASSVDADGTCLECGAKNLI